MSDALLGLDVGTSSTKAVLFDLAGNELTRAESAPYPLQTPAPGWVEQDPDQLWAALTSVIGKVADQNRSGANLLGICMAVQSGSLLAVDRYDRPLTPLITWLDGRTKALIEKWKHQEIAKNVRRLSGWSLYPGLPLPTIAWLREQAPDIFKKAAHFLSVNDFLAYRLTGKRVTNPSNAGGMQLVNIQEPEWQMELCQLAGISPDKLSRIFPSGTQIGLLKPQLSQEWGLPEGIPLINGGHDQACAALGLGVLHPGRMLLSCGTAWVYSSPSLEPDLDLLPLSLDANYHILPDTWIISQSLGGQGASLSWWIDQTGSGSREERYQALNSALDGTIPNQGLFFLPMTGGYDGPATTRLGGFVGLGLNHTWGDMGRAIMESPGYELRWALEAWDQFEKLERLWMVGGAASSSHWPAILASITGIPIQVPEYDNWPALGAAILAGIGTGVYADAEEAAGIFRRSQQSIEPDPALVCVYQELYEKYRHYRQVWYDLQVDSFGAAEPVCGD